MDLAHQVQQQGWLLTFAMVFGWGLAMNLTPCVYPMIPITISYFGGLAGNKASRAPLLALLFVLGLSVTYSVLGVSAALTGRLFGASLANPWVVGFTSLVMAGMGASLLGFFQITVPSGMLSRIQERRDRMGWLGALFFGLVAGLVMAPCVGPFIVSLLAYVASTHDPVLGFWLFFTLAFGMGLPYLVLGTFTGALKSLPRPGTWMLWLERVFGLILIGYGLKLWTPFMAPATALRVMGAYVAAAGVFLGFFAGSDAPRRFRMIRSAVGVLLVAAGALTVLAWPSGPLRYAVGAGGRTAWISLASGAKSSEVRFEPYTPARLAAARAAHQPVFIDFYARWCAACNELDQKTWSDPAVAVAAHRFVAMKADLTTEADADLSSVPALRDFHLQGLPTVVFIGPDGRQIGKLRLEAFAPPPRMIKLLNAVPRR